MTAARNEPPVALRRLLPEPGELTADELVQALAAVGAGAAPRGRTSR